MMPFPRFTGMGKSSSVFRNLNRSFTTQTHSQTVNKFISPITAAKLTSSSSILSSSTSKSSSSTMTSSSIGPHARYGQSRSVITDGTPMYDVVLIGAGVMSSTLGVMLQELEPTWKIKLVEILDKAGEESSNGWNNAGTGHSALCELNYTPETMDHDGGGGIGTPTINIQNALKINEQFQVSRQFWSHCYTSGLFGKGADPREFFTQAPHMVFCKGEKDIDFLQRRHNLLMKEPLFALQDMVYCDDREQIEKWSPLLVRGRKASEEIAVTRTSQGTDCNFGVLTKKLAKSLEFNGAACRYNTEVMSITKEEDHYLVTVKPRNSGMFKLPGFGLPGISLPGMDDPLSGFAEKEIEEIRAKFVFVGAGGYSLNLLQLAKIPEISGYGAFPISGKFLSCSKPEVVEQHKNKVYGRAQCGAPPMSVPHLDIRRLDNREYLLFGPYAGFAPSFTKVSGSPMDFINSVNPFNIAPMCAAGAQNLDLSLYLAKEMSATHDDHMRDLREFYPEAKDDEWSLRTAGQRVQIMKHDEEKIGKLQFGTEIVSHVEEDSSIAGLLGASPGASVSVSIAVETLQRMYPDKFKNEWHEKLVKMMPGHGQKLNENPELAEKILEDTRVALGLEKDY